MSEELQPTAQPVTASLEQTTEAQQTETQPQQDAGGNEQEVITLTKEELDKQLKSFADQHMSKSYPTIAENLHAKWEKEYEAKLKEQEELAKLNAEERIEYEKRKLDKEREEFTAVREKLELRDKVKDFLISQKADIEILDLIQAETYDEALAKYEKIQSIIGKRTQATNQEWVSKIPEARSGIPGVHTEVDKSKMSALELLKFERTKKE